MDIAITVNGRSFVRDLNLLTPSQKQALGEFLGVDDERDKVFAGSVFADRQRFIPITTADVRGWCPVGNKFKVKFSSDDVGDPVRLPGGYTHTRRRHVGRGYCHKCGLQHTVVKFGELISIEVEGLPFSREYEVEEAD